MIPPMSSMFNKQFFEDLDDHVHAYFKEWPWLKGLNVKIVTAVGEFWCMEKGFRQALEHGVAIAYDEPAECEPRPAGSPKTREHQWAFPVVFIPYSTILSVRILPAAKGGIFGFQKAAAPEAEAL